jgi:assimilatory nitrate reductase catalytic subunit
VPFAGPAQPGETPARTGLLVRAAAYEAPPDALLARIETLLGLAGADTLRYADPRRGQRRAMRLVRHGNGASLDAHLDAFLLGGDTSAQAWVRALLQEQLPAQSFGRLLLKPGASAPQGVASRGKTVCSCIGVSESAITQALQDCDGSDAERLATLQQGLRCGTQCGSCVPELRRMVHGTPVRSDKRQAA